MKLVDRGSPQRWGIETSTVKNVTMANHRIDDGKVMEVLGAYDIARIVVQRVSISFFLGWLRLYFL